MTQTIWNAKAKAKAKAKVEQHFIFCSNGKDSAIVVSKINFKKELSHINSTEDINFSITAA